MMKAPVNACGDMNQQASEAEEDDIPEMDLSGGTRGKYYEAYRKGTNVVLLEPDVATVS